MELKLKDIEHQEYSNILFEKDIKDKNFKYSVLFRTGAKGIKFENCDFSFTVLNQAYFRNAVFIKCKFIGAFFIDCNFRGAELHECDFKYSNFQNTVIPSNVVLSNLPEWPNVKRELLRMHRINAANLGDAEAVKLYIREELVAQREHYRRARKRNESYYSNKYSGIKNWGFVRIKSLQLWLDWNLWGHGEYPMKLIVSTIIILSIIALIVTFKITNINGQLSINEFFHAIMQSLKHTFNAFIGLSNDDLYIVSAFWTYVVVIYRIIVIGMFVSVLFRYLSKR